MRDGDWSSCIINNRIWNDDHYILKIGKTCNNSNCGDNDDFHIDGENEDNDKALITIFIIRMIMLMMLIMRIITIKWTKNITIIITIVIILYWW